MKMELLKKQQLEMAAFEQTQGTKIFKMNENNVCYE